jgi:hypothetical protein
MTSRKVNSVYKILYRKAGETNKDKIHTEHVMLPNIKSLARYLNRFVSKGDRRVVIVWVSNSKFQFVKIVHLLGKEIETQKFIAGKKQRVLAWAKYRCGYSLSIDY